MSRAAAPPLEDSGTAGILVYIWSTDLMTRGRRPSYTSRSYGQLEDLS